MAGLIHYTQIVDPSTRYADPETRKLHPVRTGEQRKMRRRQDELPVVGSQLEGIGIIWRYRVL